MKNQFKVATHEELLAAFRMLDPENRGFIKEDEMKNLIMNCGYCGSECVVSSSTKKYMMTSKNTPWTRPDR